jgi:hypothetical protein
MHIMSRKPLLLFVLTSKGGKRGTWEKATLSTARQQQAGNQQGNHQLMRACFPKIREKCPPPLTPLSGIGKK